MANSNCFTLPFGIEYSIFIIENLFWTNCVLWNRYKYVWSVVYVSGYVSGLISLVADLVPLRCKI